MDDHLKDPSVVLPYLVGRPIPAAEVYEAFGYGRSSYYKAAKAGRLVTADNLIRAANHFGLNAVDLLARYGLITLDEIAEFVESEQTAPMLRKLVAERQPA